MTENKPHPQAGDGRRDLPQGASAPSRFNVIEYLQHYRDLPSRATTDASINGGAVQSDGSLTFHPKFDPKAPADQQLKQFGEMYKNGTPDKDGNVRAQIEMNGMMQDVTIEREKMGSASLMHVRDSQGRLIMRGTERDGQWQHQKDAHGKEVSYYGKNYENGVPEQNSESVPAGKVIPPGKGKPNEGDLPQPGKRKATDGGELPQTDNGDHAPASQKGSSKDGNVIGQWNNVDLSAYFSGRGAGHGEGGRLDQADHKLYSVQEFLKDPSRPVSVAVDRSHMPHYGQNLSIPELDRKYSTELNQLVAEGKLSEPRFRFTAVDNGPAVRGKHHIDICLAKYKSAEFPDVHLAYGATVHLLDSRNRI